MASAVACHLSKTEMLPLEQILAIVIQNAKLSFLRNMVILKEKRMVQHTYKTSVSMAIQPMYPIKERMVF